MLVRVQGIEDVRVGGGEVMHKEGRVECCHLKEKSQCAGSRNSKEDKSGMFRNLNTKKLCVLRV